MAKREGTVILADPDAGMDVEARVGPLEHPLGDAWRSGLLEDLRGRAERDEAFRRYCRDLARASSAALKEWAVATVAETGKTSGGECLRALTCPKLYIYGGRSIAQPSLEYLVRHDVPRLAFPDAGHSPMIDEPARFYAAVASFVAGWSR